jgi:hypothetical protein
MQISIGPRLSCLKYKRKRKKKISYHKQWINLLRIDTISKNQTLINMGINLLIYPHQQKKQHSSLRTQAKG